MFMQLNAYKEKIKQLCKRTNTFGADVCGCRCYPQGEWEKGELRAHSIFISFWQK